MPLKRVWKEKKKKTKKGFTNNSIKISANEGGWELMGADGFENHTHGTYAGWIGIQ